jgi:hypothetical protein
MRSRLQPHGNIAFMIKNLFLDMIIWESKVDMRDIPTDITVTLQNMKYKIGWKLFVTTGNTLNTEYPVTFVPLCMWKSLTSQRNVPIFWYEWPLCIDQATALTVSIIPLMPPTVHPSTTLDLHSLCYGSAEYRYGGGCLSPRHSLHYGSVVRVYKAGV